jgi:hypothetical protein
MPREVVQERKTAMPLALGAEGGGIREVTGKFLVNLEPLTNMIAAIRRPHFHLFFTALGVGCFR